MKTILAIATLALALSLCNMTGRQDNSGNQNNSNNQNTATASPTPPKSLKDSFPQEVGEYKLQETYTRSQLKGDDVKYLPGATDALGAVYRSGTKKEQVMVGSYPSDAAAAEARDKKISGSSYPVRWTKGSLLFVAKDPVFKNTL